MTKTDILTVTEEYGKAKTAFQTALTNANAQREAAMYGLGADVNTPSGKILTPKQAGIVLGQGGFTEGTRITTGFGDRGLASIQKEQTGTVGAGVEAYSAAGISTDSGLSKQAGVIGGEAGAIERQQAIQAAEAKVAEASATQASAAADKKDAEGEYRTVRGQTPVVVKPPKPKTKAELAKIRDKNASARSAANQTAIKAGKPMPYGKGGAPKPKPQPGVKPPKPTAKKGKK